MIILEVLAFYVPDSVKTPIYGPKTESSLSLEIYYYAQIHSSQFLIYFSRQYISDTLIISILHGMEW